MTIIKKRYCFNLIDQDGMSGDFNAAWESLYGVSPSDALGISGDKNSPFKEEFSLEDFFINTEIDISNFSTNPSIPQNPNENSKAAEDLSHSLSDLLSDPLDEGGKLGEDFLELQPNLVESKVAPAKIVLGKKKIPWAILPELKHFLIVFVLVFSLFFLVTNARLVVLKVVDNFSTSTPENLVTLVQDVSENDKEHSVASSVLEKFKNLEEAFENLPRRTNKAAILALDLEEFLNQKTDYHSFDFNTLPPGNRLIIPSLDINVPLIDVPVKNEVDFAEGNFDAELEHGVVKYPTTPSPDTEGANTLIFGHTSLEWWKKNEYGYVFRNIPRLKVGDEFFVIWEGNSYHYRMVERKVLYPKYVNDYYREFIDKDQSYVTLMGCYPVGTNEKRIMIVAERIE